MIEELVSKVFLTRHLVHLEHWRTKSYAKHMALGDFYDDLIEHIDKIVEVFQGTCGLIGDVKLLPNKEVEIIKHLTSDLKWIKENENSIGEDYSYIGNLLQDLMATYSQTLYKLKNLG